MTEKMKMQANPMDNVLAKVMEICPSAVQNGKVDFDRLRMELGETVDNDVKESYDFTWVGKRAAIVEANKPINKTLRPAKDESKNWDTTENLYIEGDNLEVLKLLQESYLNKVKMIYIDPPYNTGKDFVYKDNFKQTKEDEAEGMGLFDDDGNKLFRNTETNGRFHSDWCSMMYPRLKLARDFLTDDGVIFISIDDNEITNLRKICDEVFGEGNFVEEFAWNCATAGGIRPKFVSKTHEYVLCYARNIETLPKFDAPLSPDAIKQYNLKDDKGVYREKDFVFKNTSTNANQKYLITCPDGEMVRPKDGYIYRFIRETFDEALANNFVVFKKSKGSPLCKEDGSQANWNIYIKKYLGDGTGVPSSLLPRELISLYNSGTSALQDLFDGKRVFENVKPVDLIGYFLKIIAKQKDTVLDFFSGSATTAHAVMQLNAEDGGKRKFIMVQLPETTAEDSEAFKAGYKTIPEIGKERIRRAGEKIKADAGLTAQSLDVGFRVLKLDESNMKDVYYSPSELKQENLLDNVDNIKNDRTPLDLFFGVMVDWGLSLSLPISEKKVDDNIIYIAGDNDLAACFDTKVSENTIREVATLRPTRAVFRDASFARDDAKINAFELFKSIAPDTEIKVI